MTWDPRLANIGRIFYGIAIGAIGFLTIYYRDFPYFLIPPNHTWTSDHPILFDLCGLFLLLAGVCILIKKMLLPMSLLLGTVLLLVFLFYFIPYQFSESKNYVHFGAWENAAKVMSLAGGAFVVAGYDPKSYKSAVIDILKKLIPLGAACFPLTILSYGIDHYLYARQAAGYVPSWVSNPVFWLYLTGTALIGSSVAILLKIKPKLAALLLGTMIFIWVIIVHFPKVMAAPFAGNAGEVTSGLLALACCGIAFVIAGATPKIPAFDAKTAAPAGSL